MTLRFAGTPYLYRIVKRTVINAMIRATLFAAMTGADLMIMPYTSHKTDPTEIMRGMKTETSLASFNLRMRNICGNSEKVVKQAAM